MGITAGAVQVLGAGTSAIGAYFGAKSQKLALEGQAAMADLNAGMSEEAAQQELMRGQADVAASTRRAGQAKSSQRAAMAANGIDLGEGSAAEVLTSTDIVKEQDANTLTANAVRAAWGQRVIATNSRNEASMKRAGASSISPAMAAATSLLGSAGQIAGSWYTANKTGVAPRGT